MFAQLSTELSGAQYQAITGITPGAEHVANKSKGRAMALCLDKSGSMAGRAYTALQSGANLISKSIFEANEFDTFLTVFYDEKADAFESKTH